MASAPRTICLLSPRRFQSACTEAERASPVKHGSRASVLRPQIGADLPAASELNNLRQPEACPARCVIQPLVPKR
jgi:hypothetical protein